MKQTALLIIMDGYGLSPGGPGNAISRARTPSLDALYATCPNTTLQAAGKAVGLPADQMGNSEVGHLNIGAGRVVWQELSKISEDIDTRTFFSNPACWAYAPLDRNGSSLHLMGLLSDGRTFPHQPSLCAVDMVNYGVPRVCVHVILDGRDVGPSSAMTYIRELETDLAKRPYARMASLCGRYYAMDRDNRWDRVEKAYLAYTRGDGQHSDSAETLLRRSYEAGRTDEFVLPEADRSEGMPAGTIGPADAVIFFNFRPDRARELTRAFADPAFDKFDRGGPLADLHFVCLTQYDVTIPNVYVAFPPQLLNNTLGEYLSLLGKKQLRIAETEKYAHVTFFFNGGVESPIREKTGS